MNYIFYAYVYRHTLIKKGCVFFLAIKIICKDT